MKSVHISDHFTYGKLLRFAYPSMIMVIFTSIYGVVDGLFVSNVNGDDAFAAVNLFLPVFYILSSVGFMLGSGGAALISKLFGEQDEKTARRHFGGLLIIVCGVSAVFTLSTVFVMPQIATVLGAEDEVYAYCVSYGRWMLGGLPLFILQTYFQYYFAVADKPKLGLIITVAAGVTNMLGDFLLIYVARLGVVGAAIATIIGEAVGGALPLVYFFVKKGKRLYFAKPIFRIKDIAKICANGSSELLANLSSSVVAVMYNFQLMRYIGTDGVVAYGVLMYVAFLFVGCYLGYSVGTAPIIGYHYGAQNKDELKNVYKKSLVFNAVAAALMFGISQALARPLASVFVGYDENLLDLTTHALRIYSVSFLLSGFNIYASGFFTALNNGLISATIAMVRTFAAQALAVFILPLMFGLNGIWTATIAAEIISIIVTVTMFIVYRKRYGYL